MESVLFILFKKIYFTIMVLKYKKSVLHAKEICIRKTHKTSRINYA